MKSHKQIARDMCQQGIEMTPDEVKETLASIAAKLRAADPSLPDNDDDLIQTVINNAHLYDSTQG